MLRFIVRRLTRALVTLVVFQTVLFLLIQAVPGDYVSALRGTALYRQTIRALLGLDAPLWEQYLVWMGRFFTGDLGTSFNMRNTPVTGLLLSLGPRTILVFLPAVLLGFGLGAWLGKRIAWNRGGWQEFGASLTGIAFYAAFPPWLAFVLIQIFAIHLRWMPVENIINQNHWFGQPVTVNTVIQWLMVTFAAGGALFYGLARLTRRATPRQRPVRLAGGMIIAGFTLGAWQASGWSLLALDILHHLALPLTTLVLLSFGETMLLMRTSMVEYLGEDHVLMARAKGLSDAAVRDRHVARLALLPVLARLLLQLPFVLIGSFVIERIFLWRGMGQALFNAADSQDLPVLMGILSVVGILMLVAHLALDILSAWLDPRVRDATLSVPRRA
jgi:peptide/nickel transport system permease protein